MAQPVLRESVDRKEKLDHKALPGNLESLECQALRATRDPLDHQGQAVCLDLEDLLDNLDLKDLLARLETL